MMDLYMVGTLVLCFGFVWFLAEWCQKQIDSKD